MTDLQANEVMVDSDILNCTFIDDEPSINAGVAGEIDLGDDDDYEDEYGEYFDDAFEEDDVTKWHMNAIQRPTYRSILME